MTEQEAYERYIKAFGNHIPELESEDYWNKFANGQKWLEKNFPDGEYAGYAEQYFKAYMLIACIEYEIERGNNNENS